MSSSVRAAVLAALILLLAAPAQLSHSSAELFFSPSLPSSLSFSDPSPEAPAEDSLSRLNAPEVQAAVSLPLESGTAPVTPVPQLALEVAAPPVAAVQKAPPAPQPAAKIAAAPEIPAPSPAPAPAIPGTPARLRIASAEIDAPVIRVGLDATGAMAVPDGSSNNVGWYKDGPKPGETGTAVLDAHVFAAFRTLNRVSVGDEIFVETEEGGRLRFIVEKTHTYKLEDLAPQTLFGSTGRKVLNLITCAGSLTPDGSTYTHRMVVTARLAS